MEYEWVIYEKEDRIAILTLNRQDRLNSWIPPMRVEIRQCLEDASADPNVRVVIITGAGRGFCAGADTGTVIAGTEKAEDEPQRALLLQSVQTGRVTEVIRDMNKPTICALNGIVAGSGTAFALTCDIIIASEQARFRLAWGRMGLAPGDGASFLLTQRIGTHRALELFYTNDIIDAKEMERLGLANRVVPHDELMKTAKEMAKKMFQIPPLGLALGKRSLYKGAIAPDLETQRAFDGFIGSKLGATTDKAEATKSFMEKRDPVYTGE